MWLLFGNNIGLNLVVLVTNERFLMISPVLTLWRGIIDISLAGYIILMMVILARKSNKLSTQYIVLYTLCISLILVAGIFDHLVDSGWIQFYYILPLGIFMNYVLFAIIPFYQTIREVFSRIEGYDLDKKWRTFVEESNLIVVILNRMGHVEYINPFFLRLSGYKENEVLGKDWFEFFVPTAQHYAVQSAFIEILEFDFHSHYRNPIMTKYQEQRMIDWYNVRLRNETSQVTGSISIGIDITEEQEEIESIRKKFQEAEELIFRLRQEGKIF